MAKTFELSNSYGYARITWSETNDADNNSSIVSIDSFEIKSKSFAGVTYYPKGTIKVNGATVITFDSVLGTHAVIVSRTGTYYNIVATSSASASAPWKTGTIAHNTDGTKDITITVDVALYTKSGGSGSGQKFTGSKTEALTALPRGAYLISAPNFTDKENPTITYNNVLGDEAQAIFTCISLTGAADDIAYREVDINGNSYTFELTDAERQILYAATQGSNSRTVRFYLKTLNTDGETFFRFLDKQFTVTDCLPLLGVTVYDTDSTSTALTGNIAKYIKGFSCAKYTITATPQKGASIVSYSAVCGSEELTTATGSFANIEYDTITFTVTDSRGNRTQLEFKLDMLQYHEPTINAEAEIELVGETTATVTITATGQFYECNFGNMINQLVFQVRHKVNSGDYGAWESIGGTIEFDENGYKATLPYENLDYLKGYTFQVRAIDVLGMSDAEQTKLLKLIPVFDWSESDFNFNVPVKVNGNLVVTGKVTASEGGEIETDYITEATTAQMGSNGTWYIEKWKSGKAVCYGKRNYGNLVFDTAVGALYQSFTFSQALPEGLFVEAPTVIHIEPTKAGWVSFTADLEASAEATGSFVICKPTNDAVSAVYISFHCIGRWK